MLARNKVALVLVGVGIGVASVWHTATSAPFVAWFLKSQIAKHVRAPCTFQRVDFTFLKGIELHGVEVLDPFDPTGAPLVAAETGKADYKLGAFGLGPRVTGVEIDRPLLRLDRRANGSLSIEDVFTGGGEGPAPRPFSVKLTHGTATYADPTLLSGAPLALTDVTIDVKPATSLAPDWTGAQVSVQAVSDLLGPLKMNAVVGEGASSADVTLDLSSVRVDATLPRRFVGELARKIESMAPTGEIAAHVTARVESGKEIEPVAEVDLKDASARVQLPDAEGVAPPKPVDLAKMNGRLRYAAGGVEMKELSFRALGADVRMEGRLDGVKSTSPRIDAKVVLANFPATREVRAFLPSPARKIAEAYDVTGTIDARGSAAGPVDSPAIRVDAEVRGGHVRYEGYVQKDGVRRGFPWDADDATGRVSFDGETIRVDATARHGAARVVAKGTIVSRPGGDVPDVTIDVDDAPLDEDLRRGFQDRVARDLDPWAPSGVAKHVNIHVFRDPAAGDRRDSTDVIVDLDGRAQCRPYLFPEPFTDLAGRVEIVYPIVRPGERECLVRLTDVTAKGDGMDVRVAGTVAGGGETERDDVHVDARIAEASTGARRGLLASKNTPPGAQKAFVNLDPHGPMDAHVDVVRAADGSRRDHVALDLKGASFQGYADVPLATTDVTGHVTIDGSVATFENVAGAFVMPPFAPRFTARGKLTDIDSDRPQPAVHVDSPEVPLGEPLRLALGPLATKAAAFWDQVRPVGAARAACSLDLRPDADPTSLEVTLTKLHGEFRPLGLELDCDDGSMHYDGRRAEVRGLDVAIGAATGRVDAADYEIATGKIDLRVSTLRGLLFPEDLEGPLSHDAVARIAEFVPGRLLHGTDLHLAYDPRTTELAIDGPISIRPRSRRAPDSGYAPDGAFSAFHAVFTMPPERPVSYVGSAMADGFAIRAGLPVDRLKGPLEFSGSFGSPATLDLSAKDASFRVSEYPFQYADVSLHLLPRGARVNVTKAKFMDGDFAGWVGPGPEGVSFQGEFTVNGADLETFQRWKGETRRDIATGKIDASVELRKPANDELSGAGVLQIRDGRLTGEPGVLQMFAHAFTGGLAGRDLAGGEMNFKIHGDWIVGDFELREPDGSVRFSGQGRIGFDGRVDLLVNPRPAVGLPLLNLFTEMLFRPVGFVATQRITGTLRNMKFGLAAFTPESGARPEPQPVDEERPKTRDPW